MSEQTNPNNPKSLTEFLSNIWDFFYDLLDLKDGLDKEGTIINIKSNKEMKGANAWLLMCSILIASLGLDLNSPAVIIGAMLISPLMSPILGIGLGIGINDRNTLNISGYHLMIAIGIALVTSTLYFSITSWLEIGKGFTPEIEGRTSPNILDAMVALIGGMAGIISSSRKDKSNAIPGVAIATALMPPLCVTGYGIAQFFGYLVGSEDVQPDFANIMFKSFFLFVLNATLVALATYFIVRFMDFPSRSFESMKEEKRSKFVLYFTSFVLLSVSIFTTFQIIEDNNKIEKIETFINENLNDLSIISKSITKDFSNQKFNVNVICMGTLDTLKQNRHKDSLKLRVPDAELIFTTPSDEKLKKIEADSDKDIVSVRTDIAKISNRLDSLNLYHQETLIKLENEKITKLKSIALSTYELEDIKCYLPLDKNDPPAVAVKWKKKPSTSELEDKEKNIKTLVLNLMEFDTLILTSY